MKIRISIIFKRRDSGKDSRMTAVVDHIKGHPDHIKLETLFFNDADDVRPLGVHDFVNIMATISSSIKAGDYEEFKM